MAPDDLWAVAGAFTVLLLPLLLAWWLLGRGEARNRAKPRAKMK